MDKIPTIFERDWDGNRGVIDQVVADVSGARVMATEKLDGTNVRLTIRNRTVVRAEKRRNPSKIEKQKGVINPWYVDATDGDPQDKWIYDGIKNTDLAAIDDGEYSGELVGPNIQGNPLNLETNRIVLFKFGIMVFDSVPKQYDELKEWLKNAKSLYGNDCGIEGIVWWMDGKPIGKIKLKDFK